MPEEPQLTTVVFDLGGVLLDWDPRYLYGDLIGDEHELERFLGEVCTLHWHHAHDRGVPFEESCAQLAAEHPEHAELIWAWGRRSEEMVRGQIEGSVTILRELLDHGVPCYALTNMERETYPKRVERFPFMGWFAGTVVSSHEGVAKPDPELFRRLIDRYSIDPDRTAYIDDSAANIATAADLGFAAHRFRSPAQLRQWLTGCGLLH